MSIRRFISYNSPCLLIKIGFFRFMNKSWGSYYVVLPQEGQHDVQPKTCRVQLDQCMLPSCFDLIVDRKLPSRVFVILTLEGSVYFRLNTHYKHVASVVRDILKNSRKWWHRSESLLFGTWVLLAGSYLAVRMLSCIKHIVHLGFRLGDC